MARLNESRIGGVVTDAFAVRASASTSPAPPATMTKTPLHAQHGAGIHVGLDGDVIVTEPDRAPVRGRVLVVPPDLPHTVAGNGPGLGILYDPELSPHVAAYARLRGGAFPIEGPLAARFLEAASRHRASLGVPDVLDGLAREASGWLAAESPPRRGPDRRVARVLEALRVPGSDGRLAVAESGISGAHMQALFARDVGLPIRTFRLWRRLLVAVGALAHLDATSAAHFAGFADLAHFSRTCRRMLGYSPTGLRDGVGATARAAPAGDSETPGGGKKVTSPGNGAVFLARLSP